MTPPFEIIIIGGGCAGLSLAMRLSSLPEEKKSSSWNPAPNTAMIGPGAFGELTPRNSATWSRTAGRLFCSKPKIAK